MDKRILIDAVYPSSLQVAIIENGRLEGIEYTNTARKLIRGNIYLAKVTRIEPSLQAAFIDFGEEKNGFIPFSEIHQDYYNVPSKYKKLDRHNKDEHVDEAKGALASKADDRLGEQAESLDRQTDDETVDNDVEDISSDDENCMEKLKQENAERYKIQEVLKKDQILLVQVVKEVRGSKGAMFTTYISLAGKYCVVMPNCTSNGGISRRIADIEARKTLQKTFDEINKKAQLSFIIRTAGQGHSTKAIQTDYNYLVKVWNNIRSKTLSANAPEFIHAEDDILKKVVRDLYDKDTQEIIAQGEDAYKSIISTVKLMALTKYVKVQKYSENVPIFNKHKVDEQISSLYNSNVHLKSGAYIVINQTEALTAIDINSGRSTSERNVEETAIKTNIEAAKEIVRQIKLRDLSGLIVIDFIDMLESRNRSFVERTFRNLLRNDKARMQIGRISNFGLLEMSRQYLKPSFLELNTITCKHCKGRGAVKSDETNATMVFKTIEGEILGNKEIKTLNVYLSPKAVLFMLNHKRKEIKGLEEKYNISIFILQDDNVGVDSFAMEIVNRKIKREKYSSAAKDNSKIGAPHKDSRKTSDAKIGEQVGAGLSNESPETTGHKKKEVGAKIKAGTKKVIKKNDTDVVSSKHTDQAKLNTKKTRAKKPVSKSDSNTKNSKNEKQAKLDIKNSKKNRPKRVR